MTNIRNRFPSRKDLIPVFAASVFIVFSWTIFWFLQKMPGWLPFLSMGAILSILAYTLAFALFESCILLIGIVFLTVITPYKYAHARFISHGSSILFSVTFWIVLLQLLRNGIWIWTLMDWVLFLGSVVVTTIVFNVLVHRLPRLQLALRSFCTRLIVFLYFYLPVGIISCLVVIIRNVLAALSA